MCSLKFVKLQFLLYFLLAVVIFIGCGPVKGYSGPDLPRSQVGLIRVTKTESASSRISWIQVGTEEIGGRGVLLLPGKYFIKSSIITWGEPYNCHTETYLDQAAYDSCETENKKNEKKENYYVTNCFNEANRTRTECDQNFAEYYCGGEVEVLESSSWELFSEAVQSSESFTTPGIPFLTLKPFYTAEDDVQITKIHVLEKPIIGDMQQVKDCSVTKTGVW